MEALIEKKLEANKVNTLQNLTRQNRDTLHEAKEKLKEILQDLALIMKKSLGLHALTPNLDQKLQQSQHELKI